MESIIINKTIRAVETIVINIRNELKDHYDITSTEYENYAGLCNIAVEMFINRMNPILSRLPKNIRYEIRSIHGEQSHHPRISSNKWGIQHTWIILTVGKKKVYIDPTSSQFKDMYVDIPDYYISCKKPKWYYPDRRNPQFRSFTKVLNNKIRFHKVITIMGENVNSTFGIIEFFQYDIWGTISDKIRNTILK